MSSPRWKTQAILAVTLVVLGTFAYWWEYSHRPKSEEQASADKRLFSLKGKTIKKLELVSKNAKGEISTFVFQCAESDPKKCESEGLTQWKLESPKAVPADSSNLSSFFTALNNLNVSETVSLEDETPGKQKQLLKDYDLDQKDQASKISVVLQDGKTETLYLGAIHPNGDKQYAVRDGSAKAWTQIAMIPSYFKNNLEKDLTYWRDKSVLKFSIFDAQAFSLKTDKGDVKATKKDGVWSLQLGSETLPGDMEGIESLLGSAANLNAVAFVSEDAHDGTAGKVKGETKRVAHLEVIEGKEKPRTIAVDLYENGKTKKTYVATEGTSAKGFYEVANVLKDRLNKGPKDLRLAKLLTSIERYSVKRIEATRPTWKAPEKLAIVNKDAKWQLEKDGTTKDIPSDPVIGLLDSLSGNRIKDYIKLDALPADAKSEKAQALKLQLSGEGAAVNKTLLMWKVDKAQALYVQDQSSTRKDEIFKVDYEVSKKLPWASDFFK